jgi:hypothetical protein
MYPYRYFDRLTHVGRYEGTAEYSQRLSYEGSGLSASNCPDAWRQIARGQVGGDEWHVAAKQGQLSLIDYHALSDRSDFRDTVKAYGLSAGWVEAVTVYRVTFFDDELAAEMICDFLSHQDALLEADEDEESISRIEGLRATPALCERANVSRIDPVCAFDQAALVYLEEHTDAHGVWWEDATDPLRYSAPRGVIFQSALSAGLISVIKAEEHIMSGHPETNDRDRAIDSRLDELADCQSKDEQVEGLKDLIEALCYNSSVPEHVQDRMDALAECDSMDDEIEGLLYLVEDVRTYGFPLRNADAQPNTINVGALSALLPPAHEVGVGGAEGSADPLMPELTPSWAPKM